MGIKSYIQRLGQAVIGLERNALDDFWYTDTPGAGTNAGISVTPLSAMRASAVFACVRVIAETIACVPLFLYERGADGARRRAVEHPLYRLLHDAPNTEQTSFEFREACAANLALRGNAFAFIEWDYPYGNLSALWPIHNSRVRVSRNDRWEIVYSVREPKGLERTDYPAERIWHPHGLSEDGLVGLSPIDVAREAIGAAQAAESYGSRFFANDARPGIAFKVPVQMKQPDKRAFLSDWQHNHARGGQHLPEILDQGMDIATYQISPEQAQFLETRQYGVRDIARFFRMVPHMIGDLTDATFSNIEQQSIQFVNGTMLPWFSRLEQSLGRALLTEQERTRYYIEFDLNGLLRGDSQSRAQYYAGGRQWGYLSANDIRRLENLEPVDGGDTYLEPENMRPAGTYQPKTDRAKLDWHNMTDAERTTAERVMATVGDFVSTWRGLSQDEPAGNNHNGTTRRTPHAAHD